MGISKDPDDYRWGAAEGTPGPRRRPADEGRMARGTRLLGQSWAFVRARPRLLAMPVASAVTTTIASAAIAIPAYASAASAGADFRIAIGVAFAAAAWPVTALGTFFNVAFLAMVLDDLEGREPTVRSGLAFARARLRTILAWSLLAAGVGLVLQALQQIPHVGGVVGRFAAVVGGLAWGLATFFVLPVIVVERCGAVAGVRRSAAVFRKRWGETVVADIGIGVYTMIGLIPGGLFVAGALAAWHAGQTGTFVASASLAVLFFVPPVALSSAVTQMFQLAAYRETVSGALDGPYTADDIQYAVKPRKTRRWFRRG
jgi:hypothetical protein